jgi:hypothetical protein
LRCIDRWKEPLAAMTKKIGFKVEVEIIELGFAPYTSGFFFAKLKNGSKHFETQRLERTCWCGCLYGIVCFAIEPQHVFALVRSMCWLAPLFFFVVVCSPRAAGGK